MAVFGANTLRNFILLCLLHGLKLIDAEKGTKVTEITECPRYRYSIGSTVKSYECAGPQSFTVGTPDPAAAADTKANILVSPTFTFGLSTNLVFTAVTTCPENVTEAVVCDQLVVSFGTGATSNDGSEIEIEGTGAPGLATWRCNEGSVTVFYNFFVDFSGGAGTSDVGSDIGTTLAALKDVKDEAGNSPIASVGTGFKPTVFQKFNEVDENTVVYYLETRDGGHKIFKSDATTVSFLSGDYASTFPTAFLSGPPTASSCDEAVKVKYCASSVLCGTAKLSVGSFLMFMPFVLSRFN